MRNIILSLKDQGKTIFFNSHILSEVEQICDRIAILSEGELICSGSLDKLLGNHTYHVRGKGGTLDFLNKWVLNLKNEQDGSWQGQLQSEPNDFLASLRLMNVEIIAINLSRPSLEEFFLTQVSSAKNQG